MNEDRIKRLRRKRARQRKRRRMIVSISIFFIIVVLIIVKIFSFISRRHDKDFKLSPMTNWYFDKAISQNNPIVPMFSYDALSIGDLEKADKLKGYMLVKDSNHLAMASSYAYDTKTIRNYILKNNYNGKKKLVFLTFDDGPNNKITPQILDILKNNNVHATFFVVGKNINKNHYPILKRTLLEGNAIAQHSFTHDYKTLYPDRIANRDAIYNEVLKTNERLSDVFGEDFKSNVFRYPGGHMSWHELEAADSSLASIGVEWIDWNTLVGDAEKKSIRPTTSEGQVQYVEYSLNKNDNTKVAVVLAHDAENKQLTADSLQGVIDYFKDNGYKFGVLK